MELINYCKCGCGSKIKKRKWHKWRGVPIQIYIHGHNWNGKKHSKESLQKMSLVQKGKKYSEESKRRISIVLKGNKRRLGKKHSEETKRKMSSLKKGKGSYFYGKHLVGDQSSNWQGGISKLPYSFDFDENLKEKIRKRDNNRCQLCGKTEKENKRRLAPHHINYIKIESKEENLITLCISCNSKVNFNRGFWTGFFVGYLLSKSKIQ